MRSSVHLDIVVVMATIRHVGVTARSLPVLVIFVLVSVFGVHGFARPTGVRVCSVAVQPVEHRDLAAGTSDAAPAPATPAAEATVFSLANRARTLSAQHVAEVGGSRAPPAVRG